MASPLHGRAASPHLQSQRRDGRIHCRAVAPAGARRRRHPTLRRAVVEPARGQGRDGRARALRPLAPRGRVRAGPRHAAAGHQRRVDLLFRFGRRHRAGGLREQRQPGGLRRPARERDRSAREDRRGPLLEPLQLSRLQGPDRAARRRRGDDHLLRSRGGRMEAGQGLPRRPMGAGQSHPAWGNRLRLHRPRRSPHPRLGLDPGRAPHPRGRGGVRAQGHRGGDVPSRHAADPREARRTDGSEGMAGRAPHRIPPRWRGREGPRQDGHADRRPPQLRRRGTPDGKRASRTSGSCSAITTTPGSSAASTPAAARRR